ncbi:MAG: NAD(P)-dependent alcohol dehydrogenase [Cyanobacteria bacterium]|nr:NAD(P)-dependent alcohol dehydrogenase [Cyanobacteria bacterium bin.51]
MQITAWQAAEAGAPLRLTNAELLPPGPGEALLEVLHCGLCHSDVSMLDNAWGVSTFPLVAGHEVVGRVVAVGDGVPQAWIGELRGLGWIAGSCNHCTLCLGGEQNLCADLESSVVGRSGGFASHVKARQDWLIPIPAGVDPALAGPLFCGGITVFAPLIDEAVSPTAHVAVIGIGGLGHLALQFAAAWGCQVTAITTTPSKADEARSFGAHDVQLLADLASTPNRYDVIINTSNHSLDWEGVVNALAPLGRMHQLGVVTEPIPIQAFALISGRRQITGSPTSSPASLRKMMEFCARHQISPMVETLPMAEINTAISRLRRGDVRYRFVLTA